MTDLADTLAWQIQAAGLPEPEREHWFHPIRRWRFDISYPIAKIAFEVEGGIWSSGRHTRGQGFIDDCEKYNEATLMGWHIFRIPGPWVDDGKGLVLVEQVLNVFCEVTIE